MVTGRVGRETTHLRMRRPWDSRDHWLAFAQAWVFAVHSRSIRCFALGRTRLAAYSTNSPTDCDHEIPGKADTHGYEYETSYKEARLAARPTQYEHPPASAVRTRV